MWTGGPGGFKEYQEGLGANCLAGEYAEWMKERWNHPCVVVWDAQNESVTDVTARAINKVRDLDLSGRPWDNGWAAPAGPDDAIESHPYLFPHYQWSNEKPGKFGVLYDLLSEKRIPDNGPDEHSPDSTGLRYNNAVIINEYGWLWLNRNGTPTTLTDRLYPKIFPAAVTREELLETYARNLGILTEYWRAGRNSAAVMHFCGLGYSRPDPPRGQTSDNFTDIQNLVFEPHFYKYMKWAFNPLGIMTELWKDHFSPGETVSVPVHIYNDRSGNWSGQVVLTMLSGGEVILCDSIPVSVDGAGTKVITFQTEMPLQIGRYSCTASVVDQEKTIKSIRRFDIE